MPFAIREHKHDTIGNLPPLSMFNATAVESSRQCAEIRQCVSSGSKASMSAEAITSELPVAVRSALHPKSLQSASLTLNFLSGEVALPTCDEAVAAATSTLERASSVSSIRFAGRH
jgi:hypothetical protein